MRIVTNNQPRSLIYWHELSKRERTEFDYMTEEEASSAAFFKYKGWVFTLSDFIRNGSPDGWHGHSAQSAWDAVLVKIVDCETVIVGRAFW